MICEDCGKDRPLTYRGPLTFRGRSVKKHSVCGECITKNYPETFHIDMVQIASACARECERQEVGLIELSYLIDAYRCALEATCDDEVPTLGLVLGLAMKIEPIKNRQGYRTVPVTFSDGGGSAHYTTIAEAMQKMFTWMDEDTDADEFVKAFLRVHPFIDGNGRVAFIIYNWLNGTLLQPVELPNYFGSNEVGIVGVVTNRGEYGSLQEALDDKAD